MIAYASLVRTVVCAGGLPVDGRCTACGRPALLDLFCCQGGAAAGYVAAGFCVTGVDAEPQPRYPFRFVQGDALAYVRRHGHRFAVVHGSPPCQRWSDLAVRNGNGDEWPDLITPLRPLLASLGCPWVIENVERTPLFDPVTLCGTQFAGLRVIRHRLFEASFPIPAPELRHPARHPLVFTYDRRKAHYGQLDQDSSFVQVTGGGNARLSNKRAAMGGLDWMDSHGVNEAIPPAYAEHVGRAAMVALATREDG